jgi:hypothetical protein
VTVTPPCAGGDWAAHRVQWSISIWASSGYAVRSVGVSKCPAKLVRGVPVQATMMPSSRTTGQLPPLGLGVRSGRPVGGRPGLGRTTPVVPPFD